MTIEELQRIISEWADEVFPDRTVRGSLAKLMTEELPELCTNLTDPDEYADVVIMVLDLAHQMGIDVQRAVLRKMEINRTRVWKRDPDSGFYKHIKGVTTVLEHSAADEECEPGWDANGSPVFGRDSRSHR